jgi:ceramide glucosyltransferase
MKPLRGIEPHFYATLRGFFQQDYPSYEIVFGLSDPNDPARSTIAQLQREFPGVPARLVIAPEQPGANKKMAKLHVMAEQAAHEILVISDADIRVSSNYLRDVVAPLSDRRTGMATCLYRGVPAKGLLSTLEALGMSTEFVGQVLLARWLQGVRFALGATMATRKRQIDEIGGIAKWVDYLADDYILGSRIAAAGYGIHVSRHVVETLLPRRTWKELLHQQVRWARTIRACSPRGYLGLLFAYGAPLALIPALLFPSAMTLAALVVALGCRLLSAFASGMLVCRDLLIRRSFWLIPLRDLMALLVWLASFFGRTVVWRGTPYHLERDGRIRPV